MMGKIKHSDILADGSTYEISLIKLTGLKVVDVRGYLSNEFGETTFKLTEIVLEGGVKVGVEGEHDFPYLATYRHQEPPNMDDETLQRLDDESNEDQ